MDSHITMLDEMAIEARLRAAASEHAGDHVPARRACWRVYREEASQFDALVDMRPVGQSLTWR